MIWLLRVYPSPQVYNSIDKIELHPIQLSKSTQSSSSPSDFPTQEPLSSSLASSNPRSSTCCQSATILPISSTFFTTDFQQTWLSQPQSPRLPTPASTTTPLTNLQDHDFVLFPSTAELETNHQARRLSNSVPQRVTSRTLPNQSRSASYSPGQISQQHHRRQSSNQLSVSPIQNPRVSGLISSSTSPSLGYSNIASQQKYRGSPAPHSSSNLNLQVQRTRPPVPLFSNSTGQIHTMAQSPASLSEGSSSPSSSQDSHDLTLTLTSSDLNSMDWDLTDLTSGSGAQPSFFDEPLDFSAVNSFESATEYPASAHTSPQTVSPRDVFIDGGSAPPSTTFTNLTTPGTTMNDSPAGAYSTDTSPLFPDDELEDGSKHWPSLFEPFDEQPQAAQMTHSLSSSSSSGQQSIYAASPAPVPASPVQSKPMSRTHSSPAQQASKSGRHSFTSGVTKRKEKPLPPITVEDPNDSTAVKRARNTMAARKSRQKRLERTESLECEIAILQEEVEKWKNIALDRGYAD